MTIDRATFDLSSISAIGFPDPEAFIASQKYVLKTTGAFTGTVPRVSCRGYKLVAVPLAGGGQAIRLLPKGTMISIR
jgi:hypothetical protein